MILIEMGKFLFLALRDCGEAGSVSTRPIFPLPVVLVFYWFRHEGVDGLPFVGVRQGGRIERYGVREAERRAFRESRGRGLLAGGRCCVTQLPSCHEEPPTCEWVCAPLRQLRHYDSTSVDFGANVALKEEYADTTEIHILQDRNAVP